MQLQILSGFHSGKKWTYLRFSIFMKKRNKAENCQKWRAVFSTRRFSSSRFLCMKGSEVTKEGVCLQALGLLVTTLFKIGQQKLFFWRRRREAISAGGKGNKWFERKISLIVTNGKRLMLLPFRLFNFFQAGGVKEGWPTGIWRSFPGSKRAILLKCFSHNQFNFCTYFW